MLQTANETITLVDEEDNTLNGVWVGFNGVWDGAKVQLGYVDSEGAGTLLKEFVFTDDFACVVPYTEREIIATISGGGGSLSLAVDAHPTNATAYRRGGDIELSSNSSTANISNGGTYTGSWERVGVGTGLVIDLKADQDLTVVTEYSVDGGTNTDSSLTSYYRTAKIEAPITWTNARPWVRVKVTNSSGSATTTFRLNTYITPTVPTLNIPTDSAMSQDYQALSVRPTDYTTEAAIGRRQGAEVWNKFGYNGDVDSGAVEVIASFGGTFSRMTSADTLDIVSTSANDTNGGTGVNSIVIYGIDENRDLVTAVYNMNGTSTVTTTGQQFLGVNRIAVFLYGSGGTNAGTITVTATTAGSTQAQMPIGEGVTQQMIFHVPRNYNFLASYLRFNVNKLAGGSSPKVTLKGIVYSSVNQGEQEVYRETIDTSVNNFIDLKPPEPFVVTESTILYFTADTDTNNTVVSGRFSGKLIRDADA